MRDSYSYYVEKLTGEYKALFLDVETYGMALAMDELLFEEKMSELFDIFMSAQEEERELHSVIGEDVGAFCDNFFSEIPRSSVVREFFYSLKDVVYWVLTMDLIQFMFTDSGESLLSEIGSYVSIFFLSYVLSKVLGLGGCRVLYKKTMDYKKRRRIIRGVHWGCGISIFLLVMIFFKGIYISTEIEMALLTAYLILYHLVNYKRLKKAKETQGQISFFDLGASEMPKEMSKRYEKENQRRIKKGKEPYTWKEFVEKEEKETKKMPMIGRFYLALPVIILAFFLLIGEYDTRWDMLLFSMIVLSVEYVLMFVFYKANKSNYKARLKWEEEERSRMK